jgi:hypothetical protein
VKWDCFLNDFVELRLLQKYYVSKAPWLPEVWGDEDDLWIDEEEPID